MYLSLTKFLTQNTLNTPERGLIKKDAATNTVLYILLTSKLQKISTVMILL